MTGHRTVTMEVTISDVGLLVSRLLDETRTRPIVVLSPASDTGKPRVPVESLRHRFTGVLAVIQTMEASAALSDALGDGLHVYGGAVRVVYPGASLDGSQYDHPMFMTFPEDDPQRTADAIVRHVLGHAAPSLPDVAAGAAGEGSVCPVPKPSPVPAAAPDPEPVQAEPTPARASLHADEQADLPGQVAATTAAAVKDLITTLIADRDSDVTREVAREGARADAAEEALRLLNADHHALTEQVANLRAQWETQHKALDARVRAAEQAAESAGDTTWPPTVYPDDREAQFRYEVEQRWLMTYPPEDRRRYPLRDYVFAPGFLDSLDAQIVPTCKTVDVCVEVVTQRVWESKKCHTLTVNGRGSKARTRACGDTAYRVNIKSDSPGAPRLMWWQCSDGRVELLAAAHHDDLPTV